MVKNKLIIGRCVNWEWHVKSRKATKKQLLTTANFWYMEIEGPSQNTWKVNSSKDKMEN